MNKTFFAALSFLVLLLPVKDSTAHHSVFAAYNINGSVSIDGVITEIWFKSPHIRIFVDVIDADGKTVSWNTHGHNPTALRRRGWVRDRGST